MPQMQPLVLTDKHDPAAQHTFVPNGQPNGITTLVESTGTPLGDRRITVGLTSNSNNRRKVTVKFTMPVVQDAVVNGVTRPTVVRTNYGEFTINFDAGSNALERADLVSFMKGVLDVDSAEMTGKMKPVLVGLEGLW